MVLLAKSRPWVYQTHLEVEIEPVNDSYTVCSLGERSGGSGELGSIDKGIVLEEQRRSKSVFSAGAGVPCHECGQLHFPWLHVLTRRSGCPWSQ